MFRIIAITLLPKPALEETYKDLATTDSLFPANLLESERGPGLSIGRGSVAKRSEKVQRSFLPVR
jgi:hypothetical protein